MTMTIEEQEEVAPETLPEGKPEKALPKPRGFAAIPRERAKEIASLGGKAAHAAGTAHKFTPEEASAAGRKGGLARHVRRGPGPGPRKAPAA